MDSNQLIWNEDALAMLQKIPFFARKAARKKIERRALELGESTITPELMERVRGEMTRNRS